MHAYSKLAIAALALCSLAAAAVPGDEKVQFTSTPSAVQAAVKKLAADASVTGVTKQIQITYEIAFTSKGEKHTASITEDGELQEDRMDVALTALPPAVSAAVKKEMPAGTMVSATKVTADEDVTYEVIVKPKKGKNHEVTVTAEGEVDTNTVAGEE